MNNNSISDLAFDMAVNKRNDCQPKKPIKIENKSPIKSARLLKNKNSSQSSLEGKEISV